MSRVDVLELLRKIAAGEGDVELMAMCCHAAIAELIEADKEYDAAEQECVDHHRPLFKRGKEWSERQSQIEVRCDAAIARRSAALAAVSQK